MGLLILNIFIGCGNFYGLYEYVFIDVMEKVV